jgi:Ca2+-binding RTX toxin-like protein
MVGVVAFAALPSSALGATVSVDETGGVTYMAALGELNDVELSATGTAPGTIMISDTGAVITAGLGCAQVNSHEATCSGTNRADVRLGDLGDTASFVAQDSNSIGFLLFGEDGDDHLSMCSQCTAVFVGNSGADTLQGGDLGGGLYGGNGPDSLTGGAYFDGVYGGPGADVIHAGGNQDSITPGRGNDSVDGGQGLDTLSFGTKQPGVVVDLRLGKATGQGNKTVERIERVEGTNHPDKLYGTGGPDHLNGLAGNDVIVGRGGADDANGSSGGDLVYGGSGVDHVSGGLGNDLLVGGPGGDDLFCREGHDRALGRGGDDDFWARDGFRDVLVGGRGADEARVDRRLDVIRSIKVVPFF